MVERLTVRLRSAGPKGASAQALKQKRLKLKKKGSSLIVSSINGLVLEDAFKLK